MGERRRKADGRRVLSTDLKRATVQWLNDNDLQSTAIASVLYSHELGLVPITTSGLQAAEHGLAEAFVKTFERDYVDGTELRDAETVLAELGTWVRGRLSGCLRTDMRIRGRGESGYGASHVKPELRLLNPG